MGRENGMKFVIWLRWERESCKLRGRISLLQPDLTTYHWPGCGFISRTSLCVCGSLAYRWVVDVGTVIYSILVPRCTFSCFPYFCLLSFYLFYYYYIFVFFFPPFFVCFSIFLHYLAWCCAYWVSPYILIFFVSMTSFANIKINGLNSLFYSKWIWWSPPWWKPYSIYLGFGAIFYLSWYLMFFLPFKVFNVLPIFLFFLKFSLTCKPSIICLERVVLGPCII